MRKKGQLTVFIVIAVVVLLIVVMTLFLVKESTTEKLVEGKDEMVDPGNADSIKMFTEHCFEQTAKQAMTIVSLQGGFYNVPQPAHEQIFVQLPYYLDLGQRHFPSKESIEAEMESFVLAKLPDCLNDFTIFAKQGFIVEQGEMRMDVSLHNKAQFELTFPLAIRKGSSLTELSNFFYTVDVDFNNVYSIINETVEEHQKNPNFVPLGHLSTAARDSNFKFGLDYLDNDVVVYSYIFKEYNIDSEDYVFVFAARYDWSELATGKEPDYEQEIEDQHCFVDDRCIYNLNIYNDPFIFNDYTDLFDVSTEGMIEFIPEQNDVGKHNILVRISDQAGAEKYISFEMEIVALNNPPEIREINEQTAIVGQTYTHQIEAIDSENDDIFFYAETALFEISPDGLIEFIPDEESIGFYIIEITAFDGELEDQVWFHLNIENEE